ncbi:thioredoxin O, mitochondrial-like isoform X2 [Wolffia australiana]
MGPRSVPPQLRTSILRAMAQRRQNGGHWTSFNLASPSNPSSEATQSLPTFASSPSTGSSLPSPFHFFRRSFSSGSDASQDAIIIGSEEDFDKSLKRVQEGALPAIFYFSAAWCGPCKFLSPVVNQLSKMYPPCVTYKIDIDMENGPTLSFTIAAAPSQLPLLFPHQPVIC